MDEWSEYIKKCEVDAGTLLGKNLAFEVEASDEMKVGRWVLELGNFNVGRTGTYF